MWKGAPISGFHLLRRTSASDGATNSRDNLCARVVTQNERELSDILKLERDVAQAISGQIRVRLTPAEQNRFASTRTLDPKAHEAYLRGRYHLAKLNESDLSRAIDYFQCTTQIQPDFAAAYAGPRLCPKRLRVGGL